MNRNTELHFSKTPQINVKRSRFDLSSSHKTTFNTGDIIPIYTDTDILPGDTVNMNMAELVRMATPIHPIMDNLYMDIYWFFVPHRLVWDHWAEFWGENEDPWVRETEYNIPTITAPSGGWQKGTIADYMGIPTKVNNIKPNAFGFRAYSKIWRDWFRDENLKPASHLYKDDTNRTGSNGNNYITDIELGGMPAKAAKLHDYFTSALPQPQKGPAVEIPIGATAPITGQSGTLTVNIPQQSVSIPSKTLTLGAASNWTPTLRDGTTINNNAAIKKFAMYHPATATGSLQDFTIRTDSTNWTGAEATPYTNEVYFTNAGINDTARTGTLAAHTGTANLNQLNGLQVDLSSATAATVNQLRTAFAIQKYYENAGLHGTRYIEYIRSVFGVTSSDARMQRAEYLGGQRIPINIDQVLQTSATNEVSPQGNTAAFSCTYNAGDMFTRSFEEHGTLMCLAVVRTEHTYQQGLAKMWTRKTWTDFYNPFFANLGEQAILNENIYAQGTNADKEAFGYQEAWAEYRYRNSYVSADMRSNSDGTLDAWHFADYYTQQPILGSTWIDEPKENVDRTIAVTSAIAHQFIADFYFKGFYTRPMPVYSVPGLIDHV